MTPEQLEEELAALVERQSWLDKQPKCDRPSCDGKPHLGAPYPHDPTYLQASSPLESAQQLDAAYAGRPHIQYLSDRLTEAVRAVERGENRYMTISMPPRMGKSTLTSINLPIWLLRQHPDWKIGLISHSPQLATAWGRQVRRFVEEDGERWGIKIAGDAGAVSEWQTTRGGGIVSRSAPGQSITGLGFKVMLMDDVVKDFADAHSESKREAIWDWWQANAVTRLEPPFLCIAIATRWHEDDFIGRLLNPAMNPDADKWENVIFPALAEENDPLGREPGDPLYSPLVSETREEALERWDGLKRSVGSYMWEALYQQHPTPADGSIFNLGWLRFWTTDPAKVKEGDPSVILLPRERLERGQWLDSWDLTFKGSSTSDYAVGQRWCRQGADRFLIAQQRGQWSFTQTLEKMLRWCNAGDLDDKASPGGSFVHQRLVEDAANGTAAIDVLRKKVAGIKPIKPRSSKEVRARAVTPEIESGNVYLPHPSDPGNGWVNELISEMRAFPSGKHDDMVDALSMGLLGLRDAGEASIFVPRGTIRRSVQSGLASVSGMGGITLQGRRFGL
jgi:predicted phage terminase large subunit-like protein